MKKPSIINASLLVYCILSFISYIIFIYWRINDNITLDENSFFIGIDFVFLTIIFVVIFLIVGLVIFAITQLVEDSMNHRRIMKKIKKVKKHNESKDLHI